MFLPSRGLLIPWDGFNLAAFLPGRTPLPWENRYLQECSARGGSR